MILTKSLASSPPSAALISSVGMIPLYNAKGRVIHAGTYRATDQKAPDR